MGAYGWGTKRSVADWLFAEGYRFEFHQAVRLLELLYPHKAPVGLAFDPGREIVRFSSSPGLAFPQSEIDTAEPALDGAPAAMTVNFMGLAGLFGPLPTAYTELVLERLARKDTAMRDFLDMFNHRLVSLAYRARRLHRIALETRSAEQSPLAPFLFGVVGLQTGGLKGRMEVEDRSLLRFAGIIAHRARSMAGLEAVVGEYFDIPVRGAQFRGGWLHIGPRQQTRIGRAGRNNALGETVVLGSRSWDQSRAFTLHIGPVSHECLLRFLPGGEAFSRLCALVRFYAGNNIAYSVRITVDTASVPPLRIGRDNDARLGWTTWLGENGPPTGREYRVRLARREV